LSADQIIKSIEDSGLRGRGGAGFPTGRKWRWCTTAADKYVICNGDEGDPGAFMDRMILESFPYRVIEGLAIAAIATGTHDAIFYIRHEYPQALSRVRAALAECERRGWLGDHLLGSDYPLRISIKEGAGAFVCGEETALIASVEGSAACPGCGHPFPPNRGFGASRPSSTTLRRWPSCPGSSGTAGPRSPVSGPPPAKARVFASREGQRSRAD
jgi:NADH-quinone oxidoreductase subunit F